MPTEEQRIDHLDAVRGVAALVVVANHFVEAFGLPGLDRLLTETPLRIWWDGKAAVSMFFVLSGFVLSIRHFRSERAATLPGFMLSRFAAARFCRIWIPYMAVCAASAAIAYGGWHNIPGSTANPWLHKFWSSQPSALLPQMLDIHIDTTRLLVPQAWTLAIELCISVLVPLGILAAARSTTLLLATAAICVFFNISSTYVLHFAIGIALAKHWWTLLAHLEFSIPRKLALATGGLVLYSHPNILPNVLGLHQMDLDWILPALGSAALLLVASASATIKRVLSNAAFHHVGRVSYSIYLIHMLIVICLTPRIMLMAHELSRPMGWTIGLALTVGCSIALGTICFYLVEVPCMALGKWVKTSGLTPAIVPGPSPSPSPRAAEPTVRRVAA